MKKDKMQIVNPMNENDFDDICDAGVKLVEHLKKLLATAGLSQHAAAGVLAMAVGGVIKSQDIDPDEFMQATFISHQMWRQETHTQGLGGIVFDPPHKQKDFVPADRDRSLEN